MTTRTLKSWYRVHTWSSLICTAVLLLLCLTGLPLIFEDEIEHLLGDETEPPAMPAGVPRLSLDRIVEAAKAHRPGDVIQFAAPDDDTPAWFVAMAATPDADEASAVFMIDARTAAVLEDRKQRPRGALHKVMGVVDRLHSDLFVGLPGTLVLGLMGLLFLASVVSGVVVYGPFMRRLPFGILRRERVPRVRWLDLHNLLGIVTVMWALVVGATGVVNTLAKPIFSYWQATELAQMTAPWRGKPPVMHLGSLQRALETARAAAPGMQVGFVAFPGTDFAGSHHYAVFLHGSTPLTERLFTAVLIDAESGHLTDSRSMAWYVTVLRLSQPLHFGDYGGLPLKIVWALLDLVTIVVLVSGLYLWVARRQPLEVRLEELERAAGAPTVSPATGARHSVDMG